MMEVIISHWNIISSLILFAVWLGVTGYIVRTHTKMIERIECGIEKRLYRSDGSLIYMTAESCDRHHAHCERLRAEEHTRINKTIEEINLKLDNLIKEAQDTGKVVAVLKDFMERYAERRSVPRD